MERLPPRVCPRTGQPLESRLEPPRSSRWPGILFLLSGLAALVWFLARVLPKPSRAAYPCQRVAMPVASSFVLWVLGVTGSIVAFRHAARALARARYAVAGLCVLGAIVVAIWTIQLPGEPATAAWTPGEPANAPLGVARGLHPGRVVWVHDPDATSWDGTSNYWWSDTNTDPDIVDAMMSRCVRALAGRATDAEAWDALFRNFNETHGRGETGYHPDEGIAIKINMNVSPDYSLTNEPIPSPQVVRALLWQLVHRAGITESAISVYDASRCINDAIYSPCHDEFPAVRFVDNDGGGGRDRATADGSAVVHYSDPRVGASGSTRLPRCVAEATYLINLALLRGHSLAGVTLCAKNHLGSVWRSDTSSDGGWKPSNIHVSVDKNANPMGRVNSLVDLMGHADLGGKTLLFLIDALYAAVNQGSSRPARWRSSPFDNDWTSSLFASQDGVAIDSVALDFCRSEPTLSGQVSGQSVDNYLHEAALADDPPSGTFYDPEGDGTRLESLGVHEHWNNAAEKQYSRNLETGEGIELLLVPEEIEETAFRRGDCNADGVEDVSDAVWNLIYQFVGTVAPPCLDACDFDDTGTLNATDALASLSHLFLGAAGPAPPGKADCGADPTADQLDCASFAVCDEE